MSKEEENLLLFGFDKTLFPSHNSQRHNVGTALYDALLEVTFQSSKPFNTMPDTDATL